MRQSPFDFYYLLSRIKESWLKMRYMLALEIFLTIVLIGLLVFLFTAFVH